MDTPPHTPPETLSSKRGGWLLAGIGFGIILLIAVGAYLLRSYSPGTLGSPASNFMYSIGSLPGSALYTFTGKDGTPVLYQLPTAKGEQKPVIDYVKDTGGVEYYLLLDSEDPLVSNLYQRTATGDVIQMTTSATFKHALSLDPESHTLAFESLAVTSIETLPTTTAWRVHVVTDSNHKEFDLGEGTNPHVLPGGKQVLFSHNAKLMMAVLTRKDTSELLSVPSDSLYSIESTSHSLVLYNSLSKSFEYYTFQPSGFLSFTKSVPTKDEPVFIQFVGKDLYTATKTIADGIPTFAIHSSTGYSTSIKGVSERSMLRKIVPVSTTP